MDQTAEQMPGKTEATQISPSSRQTPSVLLVLIRAAVSIGIIALGVFGLMSLGTGTQPEKMEPKTADATLVETVEVIAHSGGLDLNVDGVAVPFKEVQLAAEVAGKVTFKSEACRTGSFVEANTPLIRIDRETYELELERLQRQKIESEQNIKELAVEIENTKELIKLANNDLTLRKNDVDRQRRLSKSRVGTAAAYETAQRSFIQSQNSKKSLENQQRLLSTRRARLETATALVEIQLKRATLDLDRTEIVAPVSGVVVSEMVEQDSFVQRGTSLLTLEDTSRVEVRCSLTMQELYRLWQSTAATDGSTTPENPPTGDTGAYDIPRMPVTVMYELAGRTFGWQGELARYDGLGLDEKTRTVPCRVVVNEPGNVKEIRNESSMVAANGGPRALVRGMFVKVRIHTKPVSPIIRVPELAVRPGNRIWLVRDGKLSIQKAVVAGVSGEDLLVDSEASGISPGERAIVSPLAEAVEGMKVQETAE